MSKVVTYPYSNISNDNTIFYDMVGNFIPPEWKNLTSSDGKVLSKTARQILSLIVSRIKSDRFFVQENSNPTENSKLNELQESYYYFEQIIGVCQKRIRQCLEEVEEGGYIKFNVTNIIKEYIKYHNIICINLAKNFTPYSKNFSSEPEKSFGYSGNFFPPHNIIDNNKSKSISRYEEASVENEKLAAAIENAAANNQDLQQNLLIANAEMANEELNNTERGLVSKVVNTAKALFSIKKMEEFHPLTEEDAEKLRLRSGRDFNSSFINKLLLKLAKCQPNYSTL